MTPRRTVEIDDDAAEALLITMLSDVAALQFKPEPLSAIPPDTVLVEAIMRVLRYYCAADQYAEIEAMIDGEIDMECRCLLLALLLPKPQGDD